LKPPESRPCDCEIANIVFSDVSQFFDSGFRIGRGRRLLEPIGNIPPAEAEVRYETVLEQQPMAA
jgi:hypothetical protein